MSYIESQLVPGERIEFRAHIHKVSFLPFGIAVILTAIVAILSLSAWWLPTALAVLITVVLFFSAFIRYRTSEFAVTDRRVIMKVGFVQRRTLETMLGKVEGIGVDQTLLGRLLGFGTITVTGTGGTRERFEQIAAPLEFRKHVQSQAMAVEDRRVTAGSGAGSEAGGSPREERECPFCAERILARAKICRFCGREVPAVSS